MSFKKFKLQADAAELMDLPLELNSTQMSDMNAKLMYESNAITYFAGYVARKSLGKSKCRTCEKNLVKDVNEPENVTEKYIQMREYSHSDAEAPVVIYLIRPTEDFASVVNCQLEAFDKIYSKFWHRENLLMHLLENVEAYTRQKFPAWFDQENNCYEHRLNMLKFLLLVKIFAKTRENNNRKKYASKNTVKTKYTKLKNVKNI